MVAARPILIAWSMVAGFACAGIDGSPDSGIRQDATGGTADDDARKGAEPVPCSRPGDLHLDPRLADVLVLLDRSGSMDTAFGAGSRYQAVADQLTDMVTAFQSHVRFGYMEMPARVGCESQSFGCCVSPPSVVVAPANAPSMASAVSQAWPVGGGTPTALALRVARDYYASLNDGVDNRYVLMATDGVPSCTLAGALSSGNSSASPGCVDALAEVQALVGAGVKVIVLSVGLDGVATAGETSCLEALARAGGAFYSAAEPDQLRLAIEGIFGAVSQPSCFLSMFGVEQQAVVGVYFDPGSGGDEDLDAYQIPESHQDGWYWDTSTSSQGIRITGAYCEQVQQFRIGGFEVRYRCDSPPPP